MLDLAGVRTLSDESGEVSARFPGYPAKIPFTPDHPGAEPRFALRDLHPATHGKDH